MWQGHSYHLSSSRSAPRHGTAAMGFHWISLMLRHDILYIDMKRPPEARLLTIPWSSRLLRSRLNKPDLPSACEAPGTRSGHFQTPLDVPLILHRQFSSRSWFPRHDGPCGTASPDCRETAFWVVDWGSIWGGLYGSPMECLGLHILLYY